MLFQATIVTEIDRHIEYFTDLIPQGRDSFAHAALLQRRMRRMLALPVYVRPLPADRPYDRIGIPTLEQSGLLTA